MQIENEYGRLSFDYKTDLNDEEGSDYLPACYKDAVVELKMVEAYKRGGGHHLMKAFLNHTKVKAAKLIFLDCSPLFSDSPEKIVMKKLHDFYGKYGFIGRSDDGYSRMWRIQWLPENERSIFTLGYNNQNDLHPVIRVALNKKWTGAPCPF